MAVGGRLFEMKWLAVEFRERQAQLEKNGGVHEKNRLENQGFSFSIRIEGDAKAICPYFRIPLFF
jgi:hypothetical protein